MASISTSIVGAEAAESKLIKLPAELNRQTRKALRNMGNVVSRRAKQLAPPPGYPGDDPEKIPLRQTIKVEVKEGRQLFAVIGPKRPDGSHGHLVEQSHRHFSHGEPTGVMTEAQPFLEPAAKDTRGRQDAIAKKAIVDMDRAIANG